MTKEKMFEDESFAQRFGKELYLEEIFLEYGVVIIADDSAKTLDF